MQVRLERGERGVEVLGLRRRSIRRGVGALHVRERGLEREVRGRRGRVGLRFFAF